MKKAFCFLVVASIIEFAGCSPTRIESFEGKATQPPLRKLIVGDFFVHLSFQQDQVVVRLQTAEGDVCEGNFAITGEKLGVYLSPFYSERPTFIYEGNWDKSLSEKCLSIIEPPIDKPRMVLVVERHDFLSEREFWICGPGFSLFSVCDKKHLFLFSP